MYLTIYTSNSLHGSLYSLLTHKLNQAFFLKIKSPALFFYCAHHAVFRILVPRPRIESVTLQWKQSHLFGQGWAGARGGGGGGGGVDLFSICFLYFYFWPPFVPCGILVPQSGIKPAPSTLEGRVLTTGPPGKSLFCFLV